MRVIGLMSGTSLDGVDAALVETDGERIASCGPARTLPYDAPMREQLRGLLARAPRLAPDDPAVAAAGRRLGAWHARAVAALGVAADLVGFHGQTILHDPARRRTWQIGDAALLARRTGLPVAWDFRSADVAAGGEGAPLAPLYHAALAAGLERPLAVLNIGGVANVTWLGEGGGILACDCGPGNALLDDFVRARTGSDYDRDGALAGAGHADEALLGHWLTHPFFARAAPKSLDRQQFAAVLGDLAHLADRDGAATLAAFTAAAAAATRLPAPPRRWLVAGGGRHNQAMLAQLRARLAAPVEPVEAVGWDGDALEAQCFAFLAARVARGLPLSLPATTGVARPTPGGRIVRP